MNKTKKAIVLSNTLEIIIAVVGIALILFGLRYLYVNANADQEIQSAKYIANRLEKILNSIEEDSEINISLKGVHSFERTYSLFAWSKSDKSRPDKCYFSSCICICQEENCEEKGLCRSISQNKVYVFDHEIWKKPNQFGDRPVYYVDTPSVTSNIPLPSAVLILNIKKENSEIKISHFSPEYLAFMEEQND